MSFPKMRGNNCIVSIGNSNSNMTCMKYCKWKYIYKVIISCVMIYTMYWLSCHKQTQEKVASLFNNGYVNISKEKTNSTSNYTFKPQTTDVFYSEFTAAKSTHTINIDLKSDKHSKNNSAVLDIDNICKGIDPSDRGSVTSLKFTKVRLLSNTNGKVEIEISAYDMRGGRKKFGFDAITVFAESRKNDGYVSGRIIDHENGIYTGIIHLFWSGETVIRVNLLAPIQHSCLRYKSMKKYGHVMYSQDVAHGVFGYSKSSSIKEHTVCGAVPVLFGYKELCNFTSLNSNMSFFCGKPKSTQIQCSDIYRIRPGSFETFNIPRSDKIISSQSCIEFKNHVTIHLPQRAIDPQTKSVSCNKRPIRETWLEEKPTGFRLYGDWCFTNCLTNLNHSITFYRHCLRGKTVFIMGDTMLRQYAQYLLQYVLGIQNMSLVDADAKGYAKHTFNKHNITLVYQRHELPFHGPAIAIQKGVRSIPQELELLSRNHDPGEDLIVLVNYNTQLQPYLPTVYRERITKLATAIKKLKKTRPRCMLFFKGPHSYSGGDRSIFYNPHISIIFEQILFQEFSKIMDSVTYLDTWSVTVAHDSQDFHPNVKTLDSQMQQFMSYVCSESDNLTK